MYRNVLFCHLLFLFSFTFSIASRLDELEYCRVRLTGYYDHTRELLMWPRSLLSDGRQQSISAPGAHVITPFYCYELQ